MCCTPEEFRRALSQAFGEAVSEDASGLLLAEGKVQLHFALQREKTRQIGALQLAALLAKVDRVTLRGGG